MATKTSKEYIRQVGFNTLISRSLRELFNPHSRNSLIDYDSLKLIDKSQMHFFVQYLGAFSMVIGLSLLSGLFIIDFKPVDNNGQEQVASKSIDVVYIEPQLQDSNVLGVSTAEISNSICSFSIDSIRYSDGASFSGSTKDGLCVDYPLKNSSVIWQINTKANGHFVARGDCLEVDDYSVVSDVEALVVSEFDMVEGSCTLIFSN